MVAIYADDWGWQADGEVGVSKKEQEGTDWLERRGITDPDILAAMRAVPREKFYTDGGDASSSKLDGITITPVEVVAKMIEALNVSPHSMVLQVGTGSGYTAAVLSKLGQAVFTVERDVEVAKAAQARLGELGFKNVQVLYGPNLKQYAANAPYDAILVSAGMARLPARLAKRLSVGGVLVAPVGQGRKQQLVRTKRIDDDTFREEHVGDLRVAPLLGDILVEMGVVDREDVEMAALEADVKGKRLGEALLEGHYVEESDIYAALARQNEMQLVTAEEVLRELDSDKLTRYPKAFLAHNRLIPIHDRDGMLHAVTSDPRTDAGELAYAMGLHAIDLHLITPTDYGIALAAIDRGEVGQPGTAPESGTSEPSFGADTIAFFERTVGQAIASRASDIHFERHEDDVEVFFRVDGELRERPDIKMTNDLLAEVIELVKVSGRLDRKERRRPQSGHFQRRFSNHVYDVQARTVPTVFGETVSLRILPQDAEVLTIDELGFTTDIAQQLKNDLDRRSGLLLIVGPASSGRSTTMYSGLQHITRDRARKVVAVEDPITYSLRGVHQYRIDEQVFGVSSAIEAAVMSDADVLLIGEITNHEIARQAIRASRAGRLVLASISGGSAVDGLLRLLEFGVSPHAVASEVIAVIAQRLVKRVCTECRERTDFDAELLETVFGPRPPAELIAFAGIGCSHCEGHGTRGRIPVTEYLPVDASVQIAVGANPTADGLRAASVNAGTTAMLDTGVRFVKSGIIPQDELRWIPNWS